MKFKHSKFPLNGLYSILFLILIIQCFFSNKGQLLDSTLSSPRIGLYPKDNTQSTLPLRSIVINAKLEDGFATVDMTQEYYNPCSKPLETTFLFPKDKDSVFTSFQAIKSNQTIIGKVEEKEKAREIYKQNLEQGNTVAYAEINEATHDVLQIDVGNILAGETIQIKFIYSEPVDIVLNKFWRFTILSTLTPRYTPFSNTQTNLPNIQHQPENENSYTWKINVELISPQSPIQIIYSPSHSIVQRYNIDRTIAEISLDPTVRNVPNKDFVLYYKDQNINIPSGLVERFDASQLLSSQNPTMLPGGGQNDYIAFISFFPILNSFTDDQALQILALPNATLNSINSQSFQQDIVNSRGEFIFIADRSGSMDGARIQNLKNALIRFLQILPKDSLFNIVSFGSTYEIMYPESLPTTSDNIARTTSTIQQFNADFGGTEILQAIQAATTLPLSPRYPRSIFLLTDGDVTNADQVISYVDSNSDQIRYCTVGIGNGISPYLIETVANVGHCSYEYVKDGEDIGNKALSLLQAAISPYLGDFQITYNCISPGCYIDNSNIGGPLNFLPNAANINPTRSIIKAVIPEKDRLPYILKNQLFKLWIFFDEGLVTGQEIIDVTITYTNYFTNQLMSNVIRLQLPNADIGVRLHQIGYNDLNNQLMIKSILEPSLSDSIKQAIINNSLKYQILSEYTAFILVINEVVNNTIVQRPIKVDIPSISSIDYKNSPFGGPMPMMANINVQAPIAAIVSAPQIMAASQPLMDMVETTNIAPVVGPRYILPPILLPPPPPLVIVPEPPADLCQGSWLDPQILENLSIMVPVSSQGRILTEDPSVILFHDVISDLALPNNLDQSLQSDDDDSNSYGPKVIVTSKEVAMKDHDDGLLSSNSSRLLIAPIQTLLFILVVIYWFFISFYIVIKSLGVDMPKMLISLSHLLFIV